MKRGLAGLLAALVVVSMAAPVMAATAINFGADAAQDPFIAADTTKATHDLGDWGANETAALTYENNSGAAAQLPATVNQSDDVNDIGSGYVNPYSYTVTDINATDYGAFPHQKPNVSGLDAGEWTTDAAGTAGTVSVTNTNTAPNVDAVQISTSSQSSSDTAVATFSNFSVTADAEKRYLQAALDVSALDSGASVALRAVDADGDYVEANISSSLVATNDDVIANGTGMGYLYQRQIGSMTVAGSGDGTMSEIQSVEVVVADADATVDIAALNVEKTGMWSVGDMRVDTDDEDDFETETIHEVTTAGDVSTYDLSTIGSTFNDADIRSLTLPLHFRASDLPSDEEHVNVTFAAADSYPSFEDKQTARYRLSLPSAYDLSYANAELRQEVSVPESRYQSVDISEGVGDTEFADISSWTDVSGSLASQGETLTLDDTIQPGQEIAVSEVALITADERSALENVGAAAGQFASGGGGGLLGSIFSPLGGLISLVGGWLGYRRAGGSGGS